MMIACKVVNAKNTTMKNITIASIALMLTGCTSLGVSPWERQHLAKPEMELNSSPISNALDDHIYFSKEASSGGRSFGGGGCGCN